MNLKKAQAVITDLFIAVAVFVILVTIITLSWDLYQIRFDKKLEYDDMIIKAFHASDSLIKSKGVPSYWEKLHDEPPNLLPSEIGLVYAERTIDEKKLAEFRELPYNKMKDIMKLTPYNIYWVLKHENGTIAITYGSPPTGKLNVNLARLVIYQNKVYIMEFSVWK